MSVLELYESEYYETSRQIIGFLNDALVAEVTEERNGIYELYMEYPKSGNCYAQIRPDCVIRSSISAPPRAANPSGESIPQPFRIYKVEREISGLMKIYAAHISYWLNSVPVSPFSASGISNAFAGLWANAIQELPFSYGTDKSSAGQFKLTAPAPLRSLLAGQEGSLLDVFGGGEYEYNGCHVHLWAARGEDRGVTIEYGRNMTELDAEVSTESVVTGICPFWQNEDEVVTLPEGAVWSAAADNFPYKRTKVVDMTEYFEAKPTVAQLRSRASTYLSANGRGTAKHTVNVSFVPLRGADVGLPGAVGNEVIRLCDTVRVKYAALGIDTQAKVVATVWDVLLERYKSITVGEIEDGLAGTIADMMDNGGATGGQWLSITGGTVNGNLAVTGGITEGGTALASKYLSLSGGTINGNLSITGTVSAANLPVIQTGNTGNIPNVTTTSQTLSVNFPTAFAGTPAVFLTPVQSGGYFAHVKVYSTSRWGFSYNIITLVGTSSSISVNWLAVYQP